MDPALGIMSPFRNEAKALDGFLDTAIEAITAPSGQPAAANHSLEAEDNAYAPPAPAAAAAVAAPSGGTLCSLCGSHSTTARVPTDGFYRCQGCVAQQRQDGGAPAVRTFPHGTFKCCPTSQEEGSGVVRCAACRGWYHLSCVAINGGVLADYVALSTTRWYCPQPECCEKVLKKQMKK